MQFLADSFPAIVGLGFICGYFAIALLIADTYDKIKDKICETLSKEKEEQKILQTIGSEQNAL